MCEIKSALILKDRVICPLDTDSHEEMIRQAELDDTTTMPKFVRVEMTPADGNIFNHDPANWQLKVGQDYKPGWFDADDARNRILPELKRWWTERFVINAKVDKITNGRWFVGAGGTVQAVRTGGVVWYVLDGGTVRDVRNGGMVWYVLDGGTVRVVLDGGVVRVVRNSGVVQVVQNGGTVRDVRNGGVVQVVQNGGTVQDVRNGGTAIFWGKPKVAPTITGSGIAIYRHDNKIIVADKNIKLVRFRAGREKK